MVALASIVVVGLALGVRALQPEAVCAVSTPCVPPSPVEGVVVAVDSVGLGEVRGFSLRTSTGTTWTFTVGQLENSAEFPLSHLAEHQATSEPVRAFFRLESGAAVVFRLEDAPRS